MTDMLDLCNTITLFAQLQFGFQLVVTSSNPHEGNVQFAQLPDVGYCVSIITSGGPSTKDSGMTHRTPIYSRLKMTSQFYCQCYYDSQSF